MKKINNKPFALLFAVVALLALTGVVGCSKPAVDNGEDGDISMFDVMDDETTRLYEELPTEWQDVMLEGWEDVKTRVEREHWEEYVAENVKAQYKAEYGGEEIGIEDAMDEATIRLFRELSWKGLEVATLSFEHIKAVFPRTEWERLMREYVTYLHTAERGEWQEEGPKAQASAGPDTDAETPSDAPNMADYMDTATVRLFEQMTPEWPTMVRDGWVGITKFAPREDWADAAQDAVSQSYANAKIQGGLRGVPVAGVQDIVDPGKSVSPEGTGTTPFVLSLLSPGYTEAYELIPDGSLMREYLDVKLGRFTEKGWESIKARPDEPYPVPAPKLDAGDELEIRRMLTNAGDAEWLVQRLRSLDAGAAKQFEAAKEVTERLSVFRKLVEVDGKEQGVAEILAEYGARSNDWSEAEIAAYIELTRVLAAEKEARSQMTAKQGYINHVEGTLCDDLMSHIVGQHPRTANSSPAQCDIAQVITLTKEALQGGQKASSDQQIREAIELARQSQGQ